MSHPDFELFVAEWKRQAAENDEVVSQHSIDMAEEAWNLATQIERKTCIAISWQVADAARLTVKMIADNIEKQSS